MNAVADERLQEQIRLAPGKMLAARIKRARNEVLVEEKKLTHDRLAEIVGTSRQHLIKLEKGQHRPRAEMLRRIAEATGRPVEWFIDTAADAPFPGRAERAR